MVDPANKRAEEMAKKLVDAATLSKINEEQVYMFLNIGLAQINLL